MTNGDHIRQMLTDEYIVENCFCIFFDNCSDCPLNNVEKCQDKHIRFEWLKQEVQNNDG